MKPGASLNPQRHPHDLDEASLTSAPSAPLLSVAIITRNEESNLGRTLGSVRFAGEIIVVDSGSTDRTVEIAESFGARVVHEPWRGFAAQKNFAISLCRGTWVLSLDADEELSPELQAQLRALLPSNPPMDAFHLRRRNLFLRRWIRYGGYYPDSKLRLFRRNAVAFATPFANRPVHETIAFDGASDTLDHDLIHHAYPTLSDYLEHMDRYSSLGAELLVQRGRTSRSLPAFYANVFFLPLFEFVKNYILRLGFLDGREGLLLHLYHATYVSWKYSKSWERTHSEASPTAATRPAGSLASNLPSGTSTSTAPNPTAQ